MLVVSGSCHVPHVLDPYLFGDVECYSAIACRIVNIAVVLVNAAAASPGFFREVIILYIFDVSCVANPGMFIRDPDFFPSRISDPASKNKKKRKGKQFLP